MVEVMGLVEFLHFHAKSRRAWGGEALSLADLVMISASVGRSLIGSDEGMGGRVERGLLM